MQDNIRYLMQSINNPEKLLDKSYIFDNWDNNIDKYVEKTKELKDILITIKTLKKENKKQDLNFLYEKIQKLLFDYGNKSELACFISACDCNIENFKNDNFNILKEIVDIFIEKRGVCEFTYKEWLQAILDTGASRKKGKAGEDKILSIAENYDYKIVDNFDNLLKNKKTIAKLTTNGDFSIENIEKILNVKLDFNNQNKILDIIIKNNNKYFFIEAKHLKISGGEQDKQIAELIKIIKTNTNNKNIHFVAFLDGIYSNNLLKEGDKIINKINIANNKYGKQAKDIYDALLKNKNNLWVNTSGFVEILQNLS